MDSTLLLQIMLWRALRELNISLYFNELLKGKGPIQSGALPFHLCKDNLIIENFQIYSKSIHIKCKLVYKCPKIYTHFAGCQTLFESVTKGLFARQK